MSELSRELQAELDALTAAGTYKRLNHLEGPQGARVRMEGRGEVIVLSSNNYLGSPTNPRWQAASMRSIASVPVRPACASSAARSPCTGNSRPRSPASSAPTPA